MAGYLLVSQVCLLRVPGESFPSADLFQRFKTWADVIMLVRTVGPLAVFSVGYF